MFFSLLPCYAHRYLYAFLTHPQFLNHLSNFDCFYLFHILGLLAYRNPKYLPKPQVLFEENLLFAKKLDNERVCHEACQLSGFGPLRLGIPFIYFSHRLQIFLVCLFFPELFPRWWCLLWDSRSFPSFFWAAFSWAIFSRCCTFHDMPFVYKLLSISSGFPHCLPASDVSKLSKYGNPLAISGQAQALTK